MEVNTVDFKEYIGSKKMDVLSKMIDLPYYIVENIEAFRIIWMHNFQEIYSNALRLKDDIETVKTVVEHNKKEDKVDKELNRLGIKLYDIEVNLKNLFNDLHQNIINETESIRNMYKGIDLEVLDENKYSKFRAMNPDNYDINLLMYMVSYIKSSKEEAEKIMNKMVNELKDKIEVLVNKRVLSDASVSNDAVLREIKNEKGLSREMIIYLENYIINNLYHKGINLNGALKGLLDEISKVSNNLGISSVKIDGRNEDILKTINKIRNYDISQISINQNDIKKGMEDSERIYEFFINLDKLMVNLGSILVEIYNNGCVRELYGPLENLMEGVRNINAKMNQRIYDIDGEIVMITNELRRIEGIECEDSSRQKEETKEVGERNKDQTIRGAEINRDDAKKHFDEGVRLYNLGRDEKAIKEFDKALAVYEEAIKEFDKALAVDPNYKEAHYYKGAALYELVRDEEAIKEFDKALAVDPNYKEAHYYKAKALYVLGRYEEAIKEYDKVLAVDPNDTEVHFKKANALYYLGRYEEAIKEYDKALAIDPNYKEAHYYKGYALYDLGRYEEAIKEYDKVLAIDPNYDIARISKGNALYVLGRYKEAIKEYDKVLAVDPNDIWAHYNKGNALNGLRRYKEAIKEYDKALAMAPNNKYAHNDKGYALYNLRRYEEAIKEYDKALAIDPNFKEAHNNKGLALYNLRRYEEAIKEYDKALAIDPNYKPARDNKELALEKLKKFKK